MQDRKRYAAKLVETLDAVERHLSEIKIDKTVLEIRPDVFISYCWSNSHDAVKKGTKAAPTSLGWFDPRALAKLFQENEIRTWLDVTEVGSATNTSLFSDITKGMNAASVVIVCFSDEYAMSKNCVLEFRFAHVSLKLPIVKAIVGTGDEWRRNEIAFLAGSYPEVNLQYENPTGLKRLVELVKEELKEKKKSQSAAAVNKTANQLETESQEADSTNSAYQEIYELTQRKFLKQLTKYSSKMHQSREHPRLLCIDLINAQRAEELMKFSGINRKKLGRKWSIAIRVNPNIVDDSKPSAANKTTKSSEENEDQSSQSNDQLACIRVMCEHENEWHLSNTLAILPEPIATDYSAYLARIMRILKSGSLANDMQIFACEAGAKLLADIEAKAVIDSGDGDAKLAASYTALRKFYIESYEAGKVACAWGRVDDDLSRCEMKNGKILWLCKRHVAETNARVLNNANKANQHLEVDLNSEMLNDLDQIEIEL